jgi:putative exosortase-associated protein (TIGR04073 family)
MSVGVLAFPGSIVQQTRERGLAGIPIGFFLGIPLSVTRELVGAYEFATAPIPLPTDYQAILSPEYPWDYFFEARPR